MIKNIFLLLMLFATNAALGQVSGGLLGGLNFSKFHVTNNNNSINNYKTKPGFSAGGWISFPLSKNISFEPQLMYSSYNYEPVINNSAVLNGTMHAVSVPILLKFRLGRVVAVTAGPQLNVVASIKDKNNNSTTDDFKKLSLSATAGIELFPKSIVSVFGRYIYGLTSLDNNNNNQRLYSRNIQAGAKLKLFGKHPVQVAPTPVTQTASPSADADSDGVADAEDKCPNQAGPGKYNGCPVPDTDADGINDEEDKCPEKKGLAKYNGCPVPDTDGDAINDEEDKCPDKSGFARYGGCPVPDTDADGINDEEDKCPESFGPASNNGCPVIEMDAYKVVFLPGSAELLPAGKTELNKAVNYLKKYTGFKITIDGHTDNTGTKQTNLILSKKRADAVKAYFIKRGIDAGRLFTEGQGDAMPVADNKTPEGRKHNRRIEIKVK